MTEIIAGNFAATPHDLAGPTTISGGNWCGADVRRHGHLLAIAPGGNYRGLQVDGETLRPEALPAGVTVAPGVVLWPDWVAPPPRQPLPLALAILDSVNHFLGEDGRAAWLHAIAVVHDTAPDSLALDDLTAAHRAWAVAPWNNCLVDFERALPTLWAAHFPGLTWPEVVAALRAHPLDAWAGAATEPV